MQLTGMSLLRLLLALGLLLVPGAALAQISKTDGTLATSGTDYQRGLGGAPNMGTCGTTPAVTGLDGAGTITQAGAGVTTCTMNFSATYSPAPFCVASTQDGTSVLNVTGNTTTLVITGGVHIGTVIHFLCALP